MKPLHKFQYIANKDIKEWNPYHIYSNKQLFEFYEDKYLVTYFYPFEKLVIKDIFTYE